MTNLLATQSTVERLMALDPGAVLTVGAALIELAYTAPACPEGHYLINGVEQAWFTSPEERMDQALALDEEFGVE